VVAAVHTLGDRQAPELAVPDDQRVVPEAVTLEVLDEAGERLVGLGAVQAVVADQVPVRVPAGLEGRCGVASLLFPRE